ncbi:MAG: TetR/AcrR family transcriptional regulator [Bacteroidia bacterium]
MGITERKEKQKAELRQQILEASMKVFMEEGFENVSIRKIADIIQYSPTTVYLYFKDKNEILFQLHLLGFQKMAEYNKDIFDIGNPLIRLHKMGENYIRFGLENPEFYDLMFILPAPMDKLKEMPGCDWEGGGAALNLLKGILSECMEKNLIKRADVDTMAMAVWGMVHGLVSLANRQRFEKLVEPDQIIPTMYKSLNWLMNTMDKNAG